jgi:hypothetical protein
MSKNREIRMRLTRGIHRIGVKFVRAGAAVFLGVVAVASLIPAAPDAAQAEPKATVYKLAFLWGLPPNRGVDRGL